jgi:hypothetical protein
MRSGRRNVMNHIASRGPYLVVLSSGCGDFFYHESYCDESGIMTIYGFLNIQILCDVSSGVGLCPYMGNGCVYDLIWERRSFLGCIKLITLKFYKLHSMPVPSQDLDFQGHISPLDEYRSSSLRPVKLCSDQLFFQFLFRNTMYT